MIDGSGSWSAPDPANVSGYWGADAWSTPPDWSSRLPGAPGARRLGSAELPDPVLRSGRSVAEVPGLASLVAADHVFGDEDFVDLVGAISYSQCPGPHVHAGQG